MALFPSRRTPVQQAFTGGAPAPNSSPNIRRPVGVSTNPTMSAADDPDSYARGLAQALWMARKAGRKTNEFGLENMDLIKRYLTANNMSSDWV